MIEPAQKEIDGVNYEFMPLQLKEARKQLDLLIKKLGPAAASAIEGIQTAEDFDEKATLKMLSIVSGSVGGAIRDFCSVLTPEYHASLADTFLARVSCEEDGKKPQLTASKRELMFATKILTETKILLWCLEVQYADFFGLARQGRDKLSSLLSKMKPSTSGSQKTTIGQSAE